MDIMPKGTYRGRALSMQLSTSKNKGTPQVEVPFEFTQEPYAGQRMTWCGYFTETTEMRTLESLRHCGWKSDDLNDSAGLGDNEVELVVDHEEYNGNTRAKIQWVNKIGGMSFGAPMNDGAKREFAAKMRAKAAASRFRNGDGKPASKPADPPPSGGATGTDDNLPF